MRWFLRPQSVSLAIALAVFGLLTLIQRLGWLQALDLAVYDIMLRERHDQKARDSRITIIKIDEDYIRKRDFPLSDSLLAKALEDLMNFEPRAIGLDLYRDLPEPRDGSKLAELNELLMSDVAAKFHLTAIFSLPQEDGSESKPPPALKDSPDRIAFNDFPSDNGIVRRALLVAGDKEGRPVFSLALRLAEQYIASDPTPPLGPTRLAFSPDQETARLGSGELRFFHGNDGGYRNADDSGAQILLDFKGPTDFDTFSLDDVLEGKVPLPYIYDRIILIGNYARSYQDFHVTPLRSFAPGVNIHAQTLDQLLRTAYEGERPTRVFSVWAKTGWALFWSLAGAASGLALLRRPIYSLSALLLGGGLLIFVKTLAFRWGWWLPPVEPALDFFVAALFTFVLVLIIEKRGRASEQRERAELMQLFSRHVSEKVANEIWRERQAFLAGGKPLARNLTATVLFSDIVGFSSVSETVGDPSLVMAWLNEAMEHLVKEVEKHDGVINKFIGDSIMAIFGAPIPHTHDDEIARDAINAVRCALGMGQALQELNARWRAEQRNEIAMRIGIFTGHMISGSLGSANRLEFTVIGDTVNTASRLESTRKEGADAITAPADNCCRILIGEPTYALLGGRFEAEDVGEEFLKGKKLKVRVYRVLREILESSAASASEPLAVTT